ncbi:MAG: hypothetical protein MNPFHGCM_00757 [Gemmatimonadaceae bacterium]|nr:hypothetical protein [Gemmatimonadaceae bacterium]
MRRTVLVAAALLAAPHPLWGQTPDTTSRPSSPSSGTPTRVVAVGKDTLHIAGLTIPAGERRSGPVVVAGGDLVVRGTIDGNAIAILGDVVVPAGGHVTGYAMAALGTVQAQGQIDGERREINTLTAGGETRTAAGSQRTTSTTDALRLSAGWLIVLLLIGIGVLVFAGAHLDGVVDTLEQNFWRSFWVGVLGGVSLVPALALLTAALAISLIGILLIPFAAVAYLLAAAGLVTLGFLAVARVTGASIGSSAVRRLSARGSTLRSLMIGIVLYMGLWVIAAAFSWAPVAAELLRAIAIVVTCIAATAGFGATLLSRAGSRRELPASAPSPASDVVGWQTPTPVTGVVAARRPVSPAGHGSDISR